MERAEFASLAEIYGGDIGAWPEHRQDAALAFLDADPTAADILSAELELDAALVAQPDVAMREGFMDELEASFSEWRDAATAREAAPAAGASLDARSLMAQARRALDDALEELVQIVRGGRLEMAGGFAAALVVGLSIGWSGSLSTAGSVDETETFGEFAALADDEEFDADFADLLDGEES